MQFAMNKEIVGEKLLRTLIEKKEGYLSPFHCVTNPHMINVGEEQQLVYPAEEDVTPGDGPFHLSAAEKESAMHNLMLRRNSSMLSSTLTAVEMMDKYSLKDDTERFAQTCFKSWY